MNALNSPVKTSTLWFNFLILLLPIFMLGCSEAPLVSMKEHEILASPEHFKIASSGEGNYVEEGLVFVPAYSHVRTHEGSTPLTINLTIHNTDFTVPLIVSSVRYYTHSGEMVREYLSEPHALEAMGSAEFVLRPKRPLNESALNFIVEWKSQSNINEPVIEAVMAGQFGTHSLSFVTIGRTLMESNEN